MAINDGDIELSLSLSDKKAIDDIREFEAKAGKSLESVQGNFNLLGTAIKGAFAYLVGREIIQGFNNIVQAASESQVSISKLNASLKLAGDYSQASSEHFQDLADSIQKNTEYSDDAVLQNIALAKSFGTTNEQAEKLVVAATDLAAATGISLDEATQQLGRSLDGTAGRLVELVPATRNLTKEQLQAGDAIKVIAERFHGAAEAAGNTFQGSIIKAKNAFDNLLETLGTYIIQNPVVLKAISLVQKSFENLNDSLKANNSSIAEYIKQISVGLVRGLGGLIELFAKLDLGFTKVSTSVGLLVGGIGKSVEESLKAGQQARKELDERTQFYDNLITSVKNFGDILQDTEAKNIQITNDGTEALKNRKDALAALNLEQKKLLESYTKSVSDNPAAALLGQISNPDLPKGHESDINIAKGLGVGGGIALDALNGEKGALKGLSGLVSGAANALLPGAGAIAGPLFEALSQGPDKVREMVQSFAKAVPTIITNVLKAIPAFISELIKAIPTIIKGFIEGIPDIITAFIDGIPEIITNLIQSIPEIITTLVESIPTIINKLVAEAPRIITALAQSSPYVMIEMAKAAPKVVLEMAKAAPSVIVEMVKNAPHFITGMIKELPRFFIEFTREMLKLPVQIGKGIVDAIKSLLGLGGGGGGIIGGVTGVLGTIGNAIGGAVGAVGSFLGFKISGIQESVSKTQDSINTFTQAATGKIAEPGYLRAPGSTNSSNSVGGYKPSPQEIAANNAFEEFMKNLTSGNLFNGLIPQLTTQPVTGGQSTVEQQIDSPELQSVISELRNLIRVISISGQRDLTVNVKVAERDLANIILNLNQQGFRLA